MYDMNCKGDVKMGIPQKYETTRVNYNLPSKLVEKLKAYSEELGMPVTQTIVLLLTQSLESKTMLHELPKVTNMYEDFKNNYDNKDSLI